jgi:tetratricopeptide (TPR) repeat protein
MHVRGGSTNIPAAKPAQGGTKPNDASIAAPPVEVTQVADDIQVKPAADVPASTTGAQTRASRPGLFVSTPPLTNEKTPKRTFLQKINPFANRSPKAAPPTFANSSEAAAASQALAKNYNFDDANAVRVRPQRYKYLSPARPAQGNQGAAEPSFARGVRAQQRGLNAQAIAEYESAIRSNAAYFEAYYNLALAASDLGELQGALRAYEYALAIRPDSADARYNFALALKQANCPQDAANELEKLLRTSSQDARARLSLANLYAQRLNQPKRAREQYLKVLELDPRHPEAARIRYWLVSNP